MSWLPKRGKLDPKQASAVDFAVEQDGADCRYVHTRANDDHQHPGAGSVDQDG